MFYDGKSHQNLTKPLMACTTEIFFNTKILVFIGWFLGEIVIDFLIYEFINADMIEKKKQPFFSEIFIYLR